MNPSRLFQTGRCGLPSGDAIASAKQADGSQSQLGEEQLRRWAELVAADEAPMPSDLDFDQTQDFVAQVRRQRRKRLVTYIARCIALDVQRARTKGPTK